MNVRKTSMAERQVIKFTRHLANKSQMPKVRTLEAQKLATRHLAIMKPETLVSEQRLFQTIDPQFNELLVKKANAREILNDCRKIHGNSVTATASAFFSNPDIIMMRAQQDAIIGNNTQKMQERSAELLNNFIKKNG